MASAVTIGNAAVEAARESGHLGCWANMLCLLNVAEMASGDPVGAVAHAEQAVEVARESPATSVLLYPLFMLSSALMQVDPSRSLAAAEECIRLDQTHRRAWATLCGAPAATIRVNRGEIATGLVHWREVLQQLHWSGEVFHISLLLPARADSIARSPLDRLVRRPPGIRQPRRSARANPLKPGQGGSSRTPCTRNARGLAIGLNHA